MSLNWPKPTYNHASEYQVSSWPWVTSSQVGTSAVRFSFGHVTRWIAVNNDEPSNGNKDIYFGFTENGTNAGYHFHVHPGQIVGPFEVKCTEIWVKSDSSGAPLSIFAGLTNVAAGDFQVISGSNGFNGVG